MGTLVCKIELDKEKGITVQVDNADDQITQTIVMDGTRITIQVKGPQETSTFVQKQDSIVVTVKDLTFDTDTITMKSKGASKWTSQDIVSVESTKDMTLKTSAKLTQTATSDAKLSSSANVNIEATSKLAMKGNMGAEMVTSAGEAKVDGVTLKLAGKTQAEMSGAMTKVSGSGKLDLESAGMANLKGSITSVGGTLVKLG
jgi:predicted amino acid-binding ACT domain protein